MKFFPIRGNPTSVDLRTILMTFSGEFSFLCYVTDHSPEVGHKPLGLDRAACIRLRFLSYPVNEWPCTISSPSRRNFMNVVLATEQVIDTFVDLQQSLLGIVCNWVYERYFVVRTDRVDIPMFVDCLNTEAYVVLPQSDHSLDHELIGPFCYPGFVPPAWEQDMLRRVASAVTGKVKAPSGAP